MRTATVHHHFEDAHWWAESPDVPGWSAAADSYEELKALAEEGIPLFVASQVTVQHVVDNGAAPRPGTRSKLS